MGVLILLRHGETEWSRSGQHTGRTDIPLTPAGEARPRPWPRCWPATTSWPRSAVRAACGPDRPAGRADRRQGDPDLWEWDYGGYEGLTTEQIQEQRPGWSLWRDGVIPGNAAHPGETVQQVGERADRVLARAEPLLPGGDVALVAHGHVLRVLAARWLQLDPSDGKLFRLDTGTVSTLDREHDEPVMATWNVPPAP